jgi:putative ABC transport system permease protein
MIRHSLRLVWNRRRTNLLVTLEIFFSSLVVAAVVITASSSVGLYRLPLGFTIDDVWIVRIDTNTRDSRPGEPALAQTIDQMRRLDAAVKEFPEVVSSARSFTAPYVGMQWIDDVERQGRRIAYDVNAVTDDFQRVLGLRVTRGRWFGAEDDAASGIQPTVINERLAANLFGRADPIGQVIPQDPGRDGTRPPDRRIVGVIEECRRGDFEDPGNFAFLRHNPAAPEGGLPLTLLVRTHPGTGAGFEERLARRLHDVARGWSFEFRRLDELRAEHYQSALGPLLAEGIVGAERLVQSREAPGVERRADTEGEHALGGRPDALRHVGSAGVEVLGSRRGAVPRHNEALEVGGARRDVPFDRRCEAASRLTTFRATSR